jgi:L-iditol 2-dehydrogenase
VYKLPPEINYEVGALLEPLAVAVQAVRRAEQCTTPFVRDSCLIFGAGAVGLLTAVAAQAAGVKKIIMADIDQGRLDFAKEKGFAMATYTVRPRRSNSAEEAMGIAASTSREIGEVRWPDGTPVSKVNIVYECTGVASCVQASIYVS